MCSFKPNNVLSLSLSNNARTRQVKNDETRQHCPMYYQYRVSTSPGRSTSPIRHWRRRNRGLAEARALEARAREDTAALEARARESDEDTAAREYYHMDTLTRRRKHYLENLLAREITKPIKRAKQSAAELSDRRLALVNWGEGTFSLYSLGEELLPLVLCNLPAVDCVTVLRLLSKTFTPTMVTYLIRARGRDGVTQRAGVTWPPCGFCGELADVASQSCGHVAICSVCFAYIYPRSKEGKFGVILPEVKAEPGCMICWQPTNLVIVANPDMYRKSCRDCTEMCVLHVPCGHLVHCKKHSEENKRCLDADHHTKARVKERITLQLKLSIPLGSLGN